MNRLQRLLPFLSLILLFVGLTIASPYFLTQSNLSTVARQTAVINVIALGMTLVIISGGIDLSVGSTLALAGYIGCQALKDGHSIVASLAIAMSIGLLCGLVNGVLVTQLRINAFIVTLGTMGIYRGLVLVHSKSLPVHELPDNFGVLGGGSFAGVPVALWIVAASAIVMHFVLENTKLGRYAFAIGSNEEAAYYTGVPIKFHLTSVYVIIGVLTGLAGMMEASRLMTGQPTAGVNYELQAIAAVVIGGGSLRGGEGSVVGTLIGAFIMGLLSNGGDLLGIDQHWQQAIIGAVIIAAVAFDEFRKRRLAKA